MANAHPIRRAIRPAVLIAAAMLPAAGNAQVFEVIHPEVERGGFELEVLGGATLGGVATGDERAAFEVGLSHGVSDFWKTGLTIEIADPKGGNLEFEATEWENVLLLHGGEHGHAHGHDAEGFALEAAAIYAKLEIPDKGGIDKGAVVVGPAVEMRLGPIETVANLFAEIPFEGGEDPGLVYALSALVPVSAHLSAGAELHGAWEGAFGNDVPFSDNTHVVGPAPAGEVTLGRGRVLEPRLALLFGLTDESPDAVASLNLEMKF